MDLTNQLDSSTLINSNVNQGSKQQLNTKSSRDLNNLQNGEESFTDEFNLGRLQNVSATLGRNYGSIKTNLDSSRRSKSPLIATKLLQTYLQLNNTSRLMGHDSSMFPGTMYPTDRI